MNIDTEIKKILASLVESKNPELILGGRVDGEMYRYLFWAMGALRAKGSPPVTLIIDSAGGDADHGHDIYDLISYYPGETIGVGISTVHSSASLIIQACKTRKMTKHAKMCIHNPSRMSVSLDTLESSVRHKKLTDELRGYQRLLIEAYVIRTNQTESVIKKQLAKDYSMTAKEALAFGLIDEII